MRNCIICNLDEIENCDPGGWVWVDFRAADNFGFLVGKKFSHGNVMICRENSKKIIGRNVWGFKW